MKGIARKLKSQSGATIVFAMAVFVLVSIVSASMITIPLNAAAMGKNQRDAEQIRLSLASAAGLIRDCIASTDDEQKVLTYTWNWPQLEPEKKLSLIDKISSSGTIVTFGKPDSEIPSDIIADPSRLAAPQIGDCNIFPQLWYRMMKAIEKNGNEVKRSLIIKLQDDDLSAKFRQVTAELTMSNRYNVTVELSIKADGNAYTMTQFFGSKIDDGDIDTWDNFSVDENNNNKVTVTYSGKWKIWWPMEKYRVIA